MPFEAWLAVATAIGSALAFVGGQDVSRRERMAAYLEGISISLKTLADKADQQHDFSEQCAEIKVYTRKLKEICADVIQIKELDSLAQDLDRAAVSPGALNAQILFERASDNVRSGYLTTIREAAGTFWASAQSLRAK